MIYLTSEKISSDLSNFPYSSRKGTNRDLAVYDYALGGHVEQMSQLLVQGANRNAVRTVGTVEAVFSLGFNLFLNCAKFMIYIALKVYQDYLILNKSGLPL
jgi:hypothetical protein